MKKLTLLILGLLVAGLAMQGCGNKDADVGYGGEVKDSGGKAPPPGKGGGRTVDPNN